MMRPSCDGGKSDGVPPPKNTVSKAKGVGQPSSAWWLVAMSLHTAST